MKTRRRTVSEDRLTLFGSNTPMNRREDSEPIPIDLIFEIVLRLPAKSIARCRCVSKLWVSILRRPDFTELFLTRSWTRPQLLLSCDKDGELFFFSTPQLQNQDEKSSLVVVANHLTRFPSDNCSSEICGRVLGLVCRTDLRIVKERKVTVPVICNPSTGHSLNLPRVKTRKVEVRSFFGYDPIDKQFKILSMSSSYVRDDGTAKEHQVLTLGTKQLSWRMVECCKPHYPAPDGICINGSLYYRAGCKGFPMIVCFDVRSEKFRFINKPHDAVLWSHSTLVNYNGKLGALMSYYCDGVTGKSRYLELWVLEDPEKHEWSMHIHHVLPPLWKNVVAADTWLCFVGVIGTNEIVLSPHNPSDPFYVLYYNFERETFRRVEIQGMDAFKNHGIHTSLDHVENVKLMQMF